MKIAVLYQFNRIKYIMLTKDILLKRTEISRSLIVGVSGIAELRLKHCPIKITEIEDIRLGDNRHIC